MRGVKKRGPKRRFKEFLNTSDWEQRKLGDVSNIIVGGTPSTKVKAYWDPKEVPWMSSGEINKKRIYSTDNMISEYGLNNSNARWVKENSILIALAGQGKTRGTVAINDIPLTTNQSIAAMELNKEFDAEFIFQNLNSRYEELRRVSSGDGTRGGLNKEILSNFVVPYTSISEQVKIGNFFRTIDNLIIRCQRKLDKLQATKKALLQEMFPEEGQDKPKRRFKGFTDTWEQCKLGDLLILLKDGSHGTHKNTNEGVYLLSAKNIKNGRINIMPDDRIISWDDYNVIHKNYELQTGDILLTIVGSIGETAIYNLNTKVTFQRSVAFLRPNSKLNNGFLYTLINTDRFQNHLQTKQVVSAQPGIYLGDLASIEITYPNNISEQEKIYNIFKGIENSITLHQRKLDKLKNLKQAYLNEMFV